MNLTDFSGQRPTCPIRNQYFKFISHDRAKKTRTQCRLELLRLASTANTTRIPPERYDLFVVFDVAEVGVCLGQFET
jgi:hypothetical protein